ncbi:MAG TPA: DoxX family protein [Terriglobia bacterium]|nr:DoxX family protein [Terriglobia bacterium]
MTRFLGPYAGVAYSLMRAVFAFLYLCHGLKWLFGAFGGRPVPLTPLLTAAGIIETVGGTLMLMGFLTSCAAFVASGEMAVAYFIAHIPRTGSIIPIENGGEITVALCFGFLYIATRGSGPISIDELLKRRPAAQENK